MAGYHCELKWFMLGRGHGNDLEMYLILDFVDTIKMVGFLLCFCCAVFVCVLFKTQTKSTTKHNKIVCFFVLFLCGITSPDAVTHGST